jgi:flagellar hook-length control protein FliK
VDFTTLVAGPAQAGSHTPVSKPGIGLVAGAGTSPAADGAGDAGFASLVALALGELEGSAESGTARVAGHDAPMGEAGRIDGTAVEAVDTAPALDAPVDAVALSVLIALATPAPVPVAAPVPDVVGQGGVDGAIAASTLAGPSVETGGDAVPTRSAAAAAVPAFEEALAIASPATAQTATEGVGTASPAATDASGNAAAPAVRPATVGDGAPAEGAAPAPPAGAPAPTAGQATAPAAARGGARPADHPMRDALAALAQTSATPAESTSGAGQAAIAAQPAPTTAVTQAVPGAGNAGPAGADARVSSAPRSETPATSLSPFAPAAADARSTGQGPSEGTDAGSDASAFARPADRRFDGAMPAAVHASTPPAIAAEVGAGGAPAPAAGPSPVMAAPLAPVDLPSAARFEQALSTLDPDVRNLQAMVRTVRLFTAGTGASEARLVLAPEHLGPVALTVRVEQGSVSAHFRADTPAAHRWIETHQQELRAGLREQGLEVKELVVTTDPDGRRERREDAPPARAPRSRRSPPGDTRRFEVLV